MSVPGVGSFIQLASQGPQERILYDLHAGKNAFTNTCWKQSTRFATEVKSESFPLGFQLDKVNTLSIPRRGDMLGDITLEITLPVVPGASIHDYWLDDIGYILLRHIRMSVDDVEISSEERLWYNLSDSLFTSHTKLSGIRDMIGTGRDKRLGLATEHTIYVPLKLFCCKNHHTSQNFMPLLISPGSSLQIEIDTESFTNCVTSYNGNAPPMELVCDVLIQYVFLDSAEKERLINRPQTLLIETVKDMEGYSYKEFISETGGDVRVPTDTVTINLSEVNFPVKTIVWTAYSMNDVNNRIFFQYMDIIQSASLKFDGIERTLDEKASYYEGVQTFYHATRCVPDNVFMYSFAIDASAFQPSGHCTFGEIARPTLNITLKEKRSDVVVKVFILGYRFLEFDKGRVRIRFA